MQSTRPWSVLLSLAGGLSCSLALYPYSRYFMEIHTQDRERPAIINIKFVSRKPLVRLATLICERASQARLDEATRQLSKGVFSSIFVRSQGRNAI